jgi:hypothetical protein
MAIKRYIEYLTIFVFTIVMINVPWEQLKGAEFADLIVYKNYFLYGQSVLEYSIFSSFIDYITKEALWHYSIMTLVRDLGFSVDYVFMGISAICIWTFTIFLVTRQGILSLILLVNPLLVSLAFSQIRSALAFSLLLMAYMASKRIIRIWLIFTALFIHTSVFLFLLIFFLIRFLRIQLAEKGINTTTTYIFLCILGISVALVIGPLKELILGYFGDRRASYDDAASSFMYTSFWFGLLIFCAFQNKNFFKDEVNCYSVVILSLVTFNMLTGGYSTRFIALSFPMIISTMLNFSGGIKSMSVLAYLSYATLQWTYWMQT